jgi:ATP-dependent RNA helicase DDX47/RRP3
MAHVLKKRKLNGETSDDKHTRKQKEPKLIKDSPTIEDHPQTTTTALPPSIVDDVKPEKSFQDLGIIKELCDACEKMGFTAPRPIQVEAIPYALEGRDVIGLAETGSGKTAAFGLPMLQGMRYSMAKEIMVQF